MLRESPDPSLTEENETEATNLRRSLIQLDFVKSPLTINPCMVISTATIQLNIIY